MRGFEGYAFCNAHSTAYGVEADQSAWLQRYYAVEFMARLFFKSTVGGNNFPTIRFCPGNDEAVERIVVDL